MARQFKRFRCKDQRGNALAGAALRVVETGTVTEVDLYAAESGGVVLAQPRVTNAQGEVEVWVDSLAPLDAEWSDPGSVTLAHSGRSVSFATFTEYVPAPATGPAGPTGATGDAGPTGATGAPGSDATVPDASETVAGRVELATNAETTTGTDTARAVTPAGVKAVTDALSSVYGAISGQYAVNTVAASGATETLLATHAAHRVTMDQACEFTFSSPTAGHTFLLWLSGAFTPTFPASVDWSGGAPTYASPSLYAFTTLDGGTTWLGSAGTGFA